jgi:fluoroquinolone transport system permease protein
VVIFSDPTLLGLIFIGAIVLYEKSERVMGSLSASPVRVGEYVASKGVSLGIISTLCGCVVAFLTGVALRFLAPVASDALVARGGLEWDLHRLYPMFDGLVIAFALCTHGYATVMVMLGEMDDKVVPALCASPLGRGGWLFSRLGLPTILFMGLACALCFGLNLAGLPWAIYLTVIVVSLAACMLPGMIVVALARNKVEGVALFKMSIFTIFALVVPFFVEGWMQWLFAPLPLLWVAKLITKANYLYAIPALVVSLAWLVPLWRRFLRKS